MKILRIRRGYTTNSSSANEWLPSNTPPSPAPTGTRVVKPSKVYRIQEQKPKTQQTSSQTDVVTNLILIVGLGIFVVFVIGLERLIKYVRKIKKT